MAEIRKVWTYRSELDDPDWFNNFGGDIYPDSEGETTVEESASPYLLLPVNEDGSVQVGRYRLCYESGSLLVTVHGDDPDDNEVNVCYALLDAAAEAVGGDDG